MSPVIRLALAAGDIVICVLSEKKLVVYNVTMKVAFLYGDSVRRTA